MYNQNLVVLRARKNVPGVGRRLAKYFNAYEVTCHHKPARKVPDGAFILNYGRSEYPDWYDAMKHKLINTPYAVGNCVNKLLTLELLEANEIPCLDFTDNVHLAEAAWLEKGEDVIVRHILHGKKGKGVELVKAYSGQHLPLAPLYTKFYDKTHEFRAHVFNGEVIDLVQKKRMGAKKLAERGIKEVDMLTRNHKKGWVFAHNDLICDKEFFVEGEGHIGDNGRSYIEGLGVGAANAVGATYCGVDILARYDDDGSFIDAVVCEVNSAPGMSSPTTFKAYCEAISKYIGD